MHNTRRTYYNLQQRTRGAVLLYKMGITSILGSLHGRKFQVLRIKEIKMPSFHSDRRHVMPFFHFEGHQQVHVWNSVNVLATRVLFTNIYRAKLVCTSTSSVIKLDQNTLSPSILSKWIALLFRGIQMDGRGQGSKRNNLSMSEEFLLSENQLLCQLWKLTIQVSPQLQQRNRITAAAIFTRSFISMLKAVKDLLSR